MSDELESSVLRVLSGVLDVLPSRLNLQTTHEDVENWDSVAIVNIVVALEAELGVSIAIDDAAELVSVAKVLSIARAYKAANA